MRMGLPADLHAPILHVGVQEWDPGSGLEGVEGGGVQVGIVLVPRDGHLFIPRNFGTKIPDRMAWGHKV